MPANRHTSLCCGTANWISCDSYSKAIQTDRLAQVEQIGAEMLLTNCPKCQIHFKCALKDPSPLPDRQAGFPLPTVTLHPTSPLGGKDQGEGKKTKVRGKIEMKDLMELLAEQME